MKKNSKGLWLNDKERVNFTGEVTKPFGVHATRAKSAEASAFAAIVGALPNPDMILKKQSKTIEVYRELLYDAQVSSCVDSRKAGTLALEWEFNKGAVQDEVTAFVKKCFKDIPMYDVIGEILDAPVFGYQVLESYFVPKDGQVSLSAIVGKPQEWFSFGKMNELRFITADNLNGEIVDIRKFTVATHKASYVNPYGQSILAKCFWPLTFKKNGLKFWMRFTEKFGMPFLHGTLPRGADDDEKEELLATLDEFVQDGVAVLPEDAVLKMMDAQRYGSTDLYERVIKYCDSQISKAILSHSAGVDSTPGQLGNENGSLVVREDIVQADKRIVEAAINSVIRNLVKLNFGDNAPPPVFEMFEKTDVNMNLATRDALLGEKLGVQYSVGYLEREHGYQSGDIVKVGLPAAQPFSAPNATDDFADSGKGPVDQSIVDSSVNKLTASKQTKDAIDKLIEPIAEMINAGQSFEEVQAAITKLYGELDSTKFEEIMNNAIFAADSIGRLAVQSQTKGA